MAKGYNKSHKPKGKEREKYASGPFQRRATAAGSGSKEQRTEVRP